MDRKDVDAIIEAEYREACSKIAASWQWGDVGQQQMQVVRQCQSLIPAHTDGDGVVDGAGLLAELQTVDAYWHEHPEDSDGYMYGTAHAIYRACLALEQGAGRRRRTWRAAVADGWRRLLRRGHAPSDQQ